jgi:hypothetical protein
MCKTTLILLAGVAMLVVPAMAGQEMIDNPAYQNWSAFKVGAMSKVEGETKMGPNTTKMEMTYTLKELTDEKAVIEVATVMHVAGQKIEQKQTQNIPAKIAKPEEPKDAEKTEGTETLTIDGKEVKCKWIETTKKQGAMTIKAKVWSSEKIPGGMAKMESKMEGGANSVTTMNCVKFADGE